MTPELELIATAVAELAEPYVIGATEAGLREAIPISGGTVTGTLVKVHAVATEVQSPDGQVHLVPNSHFLEQTLRLVRGEPGPAAGPGHWQAGRAPRLSAGRRRRTRSASGSLCRGLGSQALPALPAAGFRAAAAGPAARAARVTVLA